MWPGFLQILAQFLGPQYVVAEGVVTAGASASVVGSNATGAGTLQLVNTHASTTVYIAGGGRAASTASFPLLAGETLSWPLADVTQINVYAASGVTVGWAVLAGKN